MGSVSATTPTRTERVRRIILQRSASYESISPPPSSSASFTRVRINGYMSAGLLIACTIILSRTTLIRTHTTTLRIPRKRVREVSLGRSMFSRDGDGDRRSLGLVLLLGRTPGRRISGWPRG